MDLHSALYSFLFSFLRAFLPGKVLQPLSMPNSLNASLVPDVGGGPKTSIGRSGKLGLTSFHVLYGLGFTVLPSGSAGTSLASAK